MKGGTKTLTVCLDSKNGNVLSQVETGSTNWNSVGTSIAKENLLGGIEKSLKEANVSNEKGIKGKLYVVTSLSNWYLFGDEWC